MSARTRHARFWLGLASSLALVACTTEPTPAPPAPTTPPAPTSAPSADGPLADLAPPSPDAGADAQVPVSRPPLGPAHAIVVVGDDDNPGDLDQVLENFLFDKLNFFVTVADDGETSELTDPSPQLIVISSSVDPATLGDRYRATKLPVVVMHAGVFSAMGMTGSQPDAFGTSPGRSIVITPAGALHPIGLGFWGNLDIASAPIQLNFGVPAAGATVVATLADNRQRAAIFTYEAGATMSTLEAPARRVGLFYSDYGDLVAAGEELLERTFLWAATGPL
jgi:hypothetical protein